MLRPAVLIQVAAVLFAAFLQAINPATSFGAETAKKKVLLIAGKPSHGSGEHEHNAGCTVLAKWLNESGLPIEATVNKNGWPTDQSVFDGVSAVVMYCDGGDKHMVMDHLDELAKLADKGVGIGAIHYGVEVPKGKAGNYFLDWLGGYFEADWSVNPTWVAEFKEFPKHPVTNGVKPFAIKDEWYFHMRMPESMTRVTPILTAIPPASTMARKDGPHEGNPAVRKDVADGVPQHMCWVTERPDGGRGFGFCGGHYLANFGNDQDRKLVLNMVAWIAKVDVPADGVSSKTPTADDLFDNLDKKPKMTTKEKIQEQLDSVKGDAAASK
jgi:type 1 glutamine amidotransferase